MCNEGMQHRALMMVMAEAERNGVGEYVFFPSMSPEMKGHLEMLGLVFLTGPGEAVFAKTTNLGHGFLAKKIAEV